MGCVRPTCKKAGRHAGLAARDAKNFAADVCGRLPEMQKTWWPMFAVAARDVKTWRPMFAVGCPRCKNLAADVCGRLPEMQKLFGRCLRLAASKGMCASGCKSLSQQNVSRLVIHLHKQALRVGFPGLQKLSRTLWWKPESWNVSTGANGPQATGFNFDLGG